MFPLFVIKGFKKRIMQVLCDILRKNDNTEYKQRSIEKVNRFSVIIIRGK
jgi:hypothetical protein